MEENKINIASTQNKCSSCGGTLKFNPNIKKLECVKCGSNFEVVLIPNIIKHELNEKESFGADYKKWVSENKVFKCQTCGSNVVLNSLDISTKCPYCDSNIVCDESALPGLIPDGVVLFSFDKLKASEVFKQNIKKKWFLPNKFKKNLPENNIYGLYFPSFAFDAETFTTYYGTLIKTESREVPCMFYGADGKATQGTRTEHYDVSFKISGDKKKNFKNILVESSSKFSQADLNSVLPYSVKSAYKYNSKVALGSAMEHYDNSLKNCHLSAINIMEDEIRDDILSSYDYDRVETLKMDPQFNNEKYSYVLLPMYKINYEYAGKKYCTLMNGQTGKLNGNVPRSKWKISFLVLGIILAVIAVGVGMYFIAKGNMPEIEQWGF